MKLDVHKSGTGWIVCGKDLRFDCETPEDIEVAFDLIYAKPAKETIAEYFARGGEVEKIESTRQRKQRAKQLTFEELGELDDEDLEL